MVDLLSLGKETGNLRGICPDCGRLMHRRVSLSRIEEAAGGLSIPRAEPDRTLIGADHPSANGDSKPKGST